MAVAVGRAVPEHEGSLVALEPASGVQGNDFKDLIQSCNQDGMENLRRGEHKAAFEQFKYAEAMLLASSAEQPDMKALLAVTCNNLGCYYKKVGKFHGALSYLRKAVKMEVDLKADKATIAGTHLNLCAVLSKLEKHDKALQHALCALELMSEVIASSPEDQQLVDDYTVLAIAYHNVAMEREFLEQWDAAKTAFQTGYQVAKRHLGEQHPLSITLGKNCDAVLQKAKDKVTKPPSMHYLRLGKQQQQQQQQQQQAANAADGAEEKEKETLKLPALHPNPAGAKGATSSAAAAAAVAQGASEPSQLSVVSEASDWVKSEQALWQTFAQNTLGAEAAAKLCAPPSALAATAPIPVAPPSGAPTRRARAPPVPPTADFQGTLRTQPLNPLQLREGRACNLALDDRTTPAMVMDGEARSGIATGGLQEQVAVVPSQTHLVKSSTQLETTFKNEEDIVDLIDAERDGACLRVAPMDNRPHRSMKRSTRTARMVRGGTSCAYNSTTHRDMAEAEIEKRRAERAQPWKSAHMQNLAATKIQRVWRDWYKYCQENSEWMTITWICATMIQAHWRSYHVRRQKEDAAALKIQKVIRGFLVREVMRKHKAAVTIQRRAVGMICRKRIKTMHDAATQVQRLVRGHLARRRYQELRDFKVDKITTIQKHIRGWQARKVVNQIKTEKYEHDVLVKAATTMARMYRGWKGRQIAEIKRQEYMEMVMREEAAIHIQCRVRQWIAKRAVGAARQARAEEMARAATFVRKIWLGRQARRRLREMKELFQCNVETVVTLQRYLRGCMCRLKLWRQAVKTEESLWAAIEIQRHWRGYRGRVRFEDVYEELWRRELGAALIQRNVRGHLARLRTQRAQRKLARAEFERARDRFRGAQKIQAMVRGAQVRGRVCEQRARQVSAATQIQRIQRGRAVRERMWSQMTHQKATVIAAHIRGFLVRRRLQRFQSKVVLIQRSYRHWRTLPAETRIARGDHKRFRQEQAKKIQGAYRSFAKRKAAKHIHEEEEVEQQRKRA